MASVYSRCKKLISSNTRSQKCHCVRTELRRANDLIDHVRKLETDVSALEAKVSDKAVQHAERFPSSAGYTGFAAVLHQLQHIEDVISGVRKGISDAVRSSKASTPTDRLA